ncbi:MAG: hypothetical protein ABW123_23110, partial [Cystobacter sp.]
DTDETDSSVPPRCSNGLDDDGDGLVDHGADAECASAGSDDEGLCRGVLTRHLELTDERPYFDFEGERGGPFLSCFGSNSFTRKSFHWVAPVTGRYRIFGNWEYGALRISVQSPGCEGAELACTQEEAYVFLRQGQEIVIAVTNGEPRRYSTNYGWIRVELLGGPSFLLPPGPEFPWMNESQWMEPRQ